MPAQIIQRPHIINFNRVLLIKILDRKQGKAQEREREEQQQADKKLRQTFVTKCQSPCDLLHCLQAMRGKTWYRCQGTALQSLLHYWGGMATLVCLIAEKLKRYAQNEVDMRLSFVLVFCSTELKSILPAPSPPIPPPLCYTSLAILKLVPSIKRATRRVDSRRPKCKIFFCCSFSPRFLC